jgi:predicted dehydrogenase
MATLQRREVLQCFGGALASAALAARSSAADKAKTPIKIGQIGVGHAHANKLSVYRASPDYEVVGIVEPDPALRKRAERQAPYRGLTWLTQDELLNTPGLQAVLVETHVRDLLNTAHACITAGKHVHLDKPAGASLPEYARLLEVAAKQKLLVQMGYMFRYNPAIVLLRQFLTNGWLGDVFEVHVVMSKVVDRATRRELAEFPGGIMFELGCHVIDLVVSVLGSPKKIVPFTSQSAGANDKLMDNGLAVFTYPHASATVRSSAVEVEGFERRHLTVCGTKGTFHIQPLDNPSARVALAAAQGEYRQGYQDVKFPKYSRYVGDAVDMALILRGEKEADFSYEHDLAVQRAVLEASGMPLDT